MIDSREERRYLGLEEAIDPVAGHIPSAKNYFWKQSLNEEGGWKDAAALRKQFGELHNADEIIVYCGSGVTACPNVLALKEAGLPNVKLYSGSWSDWVSYKDNPVATGKE
ncbi:sulfurtransferase [Paenibacillus sp. UNC451MF]|uniref:sulfurtransferase n=1 Tax=Paenibacillus sp. UNC451MF TaxID=1449063 RepID=UPI000A88A44E